MPGDDDALLIEQIPIGPMQNFTYVIGSKTTREVVLVDPAWNIAGLLERLASADYTPVGTLVTHYHPDHCGGSMMGQNIEGVAELLAQKPMKLWVHREEADGLRRVTGVSESDLEKVDSGDKMRVGEIEIEFLHTPGHTPGSQCFKIAKALVSGDTLFIQGCGRVDLPGSDPDAMFESLQKLAGLPDDTVLLPGHDYGGGATASLGDTKRQNPYLRVPTLETWRQMMGQ
jgi:glyoxylase-like metal-dependent hydrolase (beta-lactamase superfamily II)